jgi:hypothetical protein
MLSDAERSLLTFALEKYQPGQFEPILVGAKNLLKPALRLMTWYRLVIEEIQDAQDDRLYAGGMSDPRPSIKTVCTPRKSASCSFI